MAHWNPIYGASPNQNPSYFSTEEQTERAELPFFNAENTGFNNYSNNYQAVNYSGYYTPNGVNPTFPNVNYNNSYYNVYPVQRLDSQQIRYLQSFTANNQISQNVKEISNATPSFSEKSDNIASNNERSNSNKNAYTRNTPVFNERKDNFEENNSEKLLLKNPEKCSDSKLNSSELNVDLAKKSTLTATAAEFKPGSSKDSELITQDDQQKSNTGAIKKSKKSIPTTDLRVKKSSGGQSYQDRNYIESRTFRSETDNSRNLQQFSGDASYNKKYSKSYTNDNRYNSYRKNDYFKPKFDSNNFKRNDQSENYRNARSDYRNSRNNSQESDRNEYKSNRNSNHDMERNIDHKKVPGDVGEKTPSNSFNNSNSSDSCSNWRSEPRSNDDNARNNKFNNRYDRKSNTNDNSRNFKTETQVYSSRKANYNTRYNDNSKRSNSKNLSQNSARFYGDKSHNNKPSRNNDNYNKENHGNSSSKQENKKSSIDHKKNDKLSDAVSQRERLMQQVTRGTLECLVCCERVRPVDPVWSCQNCYHILHLRCIQKWATSSTQANIGWRCPACQHVSKDIPSEYRCFCGSVREPQYNIADVPHSCGETCGRKSRRIKCPHRCTVLCHPGPCPQCEIFVTRSCGCGKTEQTVPCNREETLSCGKLCDKMLNCELHKCQRLCHEGDCEPCAEKVIQVCYCGKSKQELDCTTETVSVTKYVCKEVCSRTLTCGNHECTRFCHDGDCGDCELSPTLVDTCPCGQTPLTEDQNRTSCLDPIPCCDKICSKKLKCGQPVSPHQCLAKCHLGPCPPCELTTLVRCRCGHMDRELPCIQLTGRPDDARCEKKCNKKRLCGRHKCNQMCCIEVDHECPLICNHMLSCGQHRCDQLCHRGRCQPCYRSSFEELYCECGASVIYPPVACGTRRPTCDKPCSRTHNCDHQVSHNCHSESECPPCTVFTHKWCHGQHEMRRTIPCHIESFTCGRPCGRELPCGRHKCISICHAGSCLSDGQTCMQPCTAPRTSCSHNCAAPCHEGDCPDTPCKESVKVSCQCGHRSTMRSCVDNAREYQRIATAMLASKMADMQLGHSIDIGDIVGNTSAKKQACLKTLECNDECRLIERNRRLAIGLQIRNPDLSAKLTPRYSDFLKQWAKKDPRFVQMVHDKLTELVQLAKQSKQKSRSHSFDIMNRDKRQFIHEYCEHFGCESAAYDQEPNRNVVATACKDKAWLPSLSLLEVLQRESGQRKVPGPMLRSAQTKTTGTSESVTLRLPSRDKLTAAPSTQSTPPEEDYIDYFNCPPE